MLNINTFCLEWHTIHYILVEVYSKICLFTNKGVNMIYSSNERILVVNQIFQRNEMKFLLGKQDPLQVDFQMRVGS